MGSREAERAFFLRYKATGMPSIALRGRGVQTHTGEQGARLRRTAAPNTAREGLLRPRDSAEATEPLRSTARVSEGMDSRDRRQLIMVLGGMSREHDTGSGRVTQM